MEEDIKIHRCEDCPYKIFDEDKQQDYCLEFDEPIETIDDNYDSYATDGCITYKDKWLDYSWLGPLRKYK